jgi:hypothetical protein
VAEFYLSGRFGGAAASTLVVDCLEVTKDPGSTISTYAFFFGDESKTRYLRLPVFR